MRCGRSASLPGVICLLVLGSGCASYQIGYRSLYRPDIRTVHVPIFRSESLRRGLGEQLTEAVIKEIEQRTPYKAVSGLNADSVLTGTLISENKRVLAEDANDNPRNIETNLLVEVNWYDQRGQFLMQDAHFALSPLAFTVAATGDLIPEGGQSVATAHLEAIEQLATQIVDQMESRW